MAREFKKYAATKDLDSTTYPWAVQGLLTRRLASFDLKALIATSIPSALLKLSALVIEESISSDGEVTDSSQADSMPLDQPDIQQPSSTPDVDDPQIPLFSVIDDIKNIFSDGDSSFDLADLTSSFLNYLGDWLLFLSKILLILWVFLFVLYHFLIILRWRAFERDCKSNDRHSEELRKELLSKMRIKEKLNKAQKRLSKSQGDADNISLEDEIDALKSLKSLNVYVNTRQALDSELILRRFAIQISMPDGQDSSDKLMSLVKDIDKIATRIEHGKVSFGELALSSDRSLLTFEDSVVVPDKYKIEDVVIVDDTEYESSFPLTLFEDRRESRNQIKQGAMEWAERSGKNLDSILATKETAAKRLRTITGASNALFEYDMSFNLSMNDIDNLGKTLDRIFKTSGATSSIGDGKLQITLPLPKKFELPIDVPEIYSETFGANLTEGD